MNEPDNTTHAVAEAEQLIAAGELPTGLERLRIAAGSVPLDHADAAELLTRIRAAANAAASADRRLASDAQEVWDLAGRRLASLTGLQAEDWTARHVAVGPTASREDEPWFYPAAEIVAMAAIVASLPSFIAGLVVGERVSKYTNGQDEIRHHAGVFAYWILLGAFAAVLWIGIAAGLNLLVEIGRSVRPSSSRS